MENIPHEEKTWEDAMENEFNRIFGFGFFSRREDEFSSTDFLEFARKWGRIAESNAEGTAGAPTSK